MGDVVSRPFNARFDAESIWKGASLLAAPEEVSRPVAKATAGARDLSDALSVVESRSDEDLFDRLVSLSRWLLTRPVRGPKVFAPLHQLIARDYRDQPDESVAEADRRFGLLQNRLAHLRVSDDLGSSTSLGDLVSREFLLRGQGAEQTLRLADVPPRGLDLGDSFDDIRLVSDGFKGCTPCKPDAESSLGGSQYCVFPDWEGRVECAWPPAQPPEPTWEYYVQVGNKWWTTFIGAWHGSAYTRTVKKLAGSSTVVPWTVPLLTASVTDGKDAPFQDPWCKIGRICSWCVEREEAGPGSEVTVTNWEFAFYGPWGIESDHSAGGGRPSTAMGAGRGSSGSGEV